MKSDGQRITGYEKFMNNIESRKFWEKLDCVMLLVSPVCNAIYFIESNTA